MKNLKLIFAFLTLAIISTACNENDILNENPPDFYTTKNSFTNFNDFETAAVDLYAKVRNLKFGSEGHIMVQYSGTDIMKNARGDNRTNVMGNYQTNLQPSGSLTDWEWSNSYKLISEANTIIDKLDESKLSDEEKIQVKSEAMFFRAYGYRELVYLYGGVPLVLHEITTPKTDFTKASKESILNQMVKDFKFAAENLPGITDVKNDGRVSSLAADHYLGETYISLHEWDKAISALSKVINNPNTALMISRFGTRKDRTPGDVYWDLFRRGNQNRSDGNTEAVWVAQMEVDVPGGLLSTGNFSNNALERDHVPAIWTLDDPDGNPGFLGYVGDANSGGRGVSFMMPTDFFINKLWQNDSNDMRNKDNNFKRSLKYTNPNSAWKDSSALEYRGEVIDNDDWRWYPWLTKVTTPANHPDELYLDKEHLLLKPTAGSTFRDRYYIRLAETYLLRAEAYLGKGNNAKSATDINKIRSRAHADPVTPSDVDIDYILDERARELSLEEDRRLTLLRLGKLVERVRNYNDQNTDDIQNKNNLWPIPTGELEANINADIEQNPGY